MSKFKLKILLQMYKGLMVVKRGLISFFIFIFKVFLEKLGKGLAKILIFPFYKLYLRYYLKGGYYLQLFFNKKVFYALILFLSLFLVASESQTYGTNKYIGGRESLLFQSLGPGEEGDFLEEELNVNIPTVTFQQKAGLSSGLALGQETIAPTSEIIGFNQNLSGVYSSPILPGVSLEGSRREIVKYVVQSGDNIPSIAQRFQISAETIYAENKLNSRSIIRPGDVLTILPVSGVSHTIKKGDTIQKIAATYKVDGQKILDFNALGEGSLPVGEKIIIPEGRLPAAPVFFKPASQPAQTSTAKPSSLRGAGSGMLWPTTARRITQYFSWRHNGIDIGISIGTPIYASDDGVIEKSGWNTGGYGYMILINHGNGIKTRYGHNSKLFVSAGEDVRKGDVIALSGSTGRSTGPHLHFEVIVGGVRVNPFLYVK
ncbi:MAG: Peptidase M23 [Candidatus Magasanikbacteria bacterium GW2011_GWC2_40_17]|uniref:Peptidase M23 n=1 Tax=Candidatus Magasanikbacteria bacterium GW2011_GWA2_42_32 TaxID=1619039 RepID=A0A0G1D508_9BACT|nr:MAG: Peptidase M23 [Candidatus Magasanikbacteria bacterium GW2011_GWC2_40_17]KKS57093.1 MAG: Peptidase M23 [Candidatus Magasanikbacteria bacterium GW2011_GWA2_42_32]OGH85383.1 MAG: hypothetical protein A2294_01300 [Candidatus Magasanikbacteria bacterium RIFOXYB2_FULL_38_10]